MQVHGAATAVAMQTMVAAPQAVAPAEAVAAAGGPVDQETQAIVMAAAVQQSMPSASTVAAMQSLAGLPAAI